MPVKHTLIPSICQLEIALVRKEVDSRKIGSRFTNFTLEYKDTYDFALNKRL